MGVRSRSKRRRGAASDGGADPISGLCDDVLLRILERLPDAGAAVRTGVLSRRWRGLWTRVGALAFDSSTWRFRCSIVTGDERFLDFVHTTLAQADAAALKHLAISFRITSPAEEQATAIHQVRRSAAAARGWIWYAVRNAAVRSFGLRLQLFPLRKWYDDSETGRCYIWEDHEMELPVMDLVDLPSSAEMERTHWQMEGVRVRLPGTAVFAALVDLSLENIELVDGSGHLLARLLSSACCPSLQRLQMRKLTLPNLDELLIEASKLLELKMSSSGLIPSPATLKLKTPSLQILYLEDYAYLRALVISAPKLEELTFLPNQPNHIKVEGNNLPCVRRLIKVELESHGDGDDDDINSSGICLLRCCTSLTRLEVSLQVTPVGFRVTDIISGRIPHLPHLISLTVHVHSSDLHSFGIGLSDILKQCSNLKYLSVHRSIYMHQHHGVKSFCDHLDHWKSHQIYLANIREVRFTGLAGIDCESSFIQGVLTYATQLQKVFVSFQPRFGLYNMIDDGSRFIPRSGGTWVYHYYPSSFYAWNSDTHINACSRKKKRVEL